MTSILVLSFLAVGCSVIVEGQLTNRDSGADAPTGQSCTFDANCISFDPFNCNRVCGAAGRCMDGPAPEGTRCGMGANMHCVGGACVMRTCGDGYVDRTATPAEYCDDGNDNPDDGCNNMCTRSCAAPAPAECGDGNECNGQETCMTVMALAFCRASEPLAEDHDCTDAAGTAGTCQAGSCVPN